MPLPAAAAPQQTIEGEFASLIGKLCGDMGGSGAGQSRIAGLSAVDGNSATPVVAQNWLTLIRQGADKQSHIGETSTAKENLAGRILLLPSPLSFPSAPINSSKPVDGDKRKPSAAVQTAEDPATQTEPTGTSALPQAPAVPANAVLPLIVVMTAPPVPAENSPQGESSETAGEAKVNGQATGQTALQSTAHDSPPPQSVPAGDASSATTLAAMAMEAIAPGSSSTASVPGQAAATTVSEGAPGTSATSGTSGNAAAPRHVFNGESGNVKEAPAPRPVAALSAIAPGNDSTPQGSPLRFDAFALQLQTANADDQRNANDRGNDIGNDAGKSPAAQPASRQQEQQSGSGNQPGSMGQQQAGQQHASEPEKQPAATSGAGRRDPQREIEGVAAATPAPRNGKGPAAAADANLPPTPVPTPRTMESGNVGRQAHSEGAVAAQSNGAEVVRQIEALRLSGVQLPRQQTVQDVEIRVPSAGSPVDVRLTDRGGNVEISVHSADGQLAQELRAQLPKLIESLHSRGYEATSLDRDRPQQDLSAPQTARWAGSDNGAAGDDASRRRESQQQGAKRGRAARDRAKPQFSIEPEPLMHF